MKNKKHIIFILLFSISSLSIAQNFKEYNKAKNLNNKGDSIFNKANYNEALILYSRAYILIKNTDSVKFISDVLNNIGVSYDYLGQYNKAIVNYNTALKLNQKHNNKPGIAMTLNNIGALYFFWEKYDVALKYYLQSLKLEIELGNKIGEAGSYENIALVYKNKKQYNKAKEYFNKALIINKELNLKKGISYSYNNIGNLYNIQQKYLKAIEYNKMALKLQDDDTEGVLYSYNNIGNAYFKLKKFKNAEKYYLNALQLAEKHNITAEILYSLKSLSELYSEIKEYKQANKFLKKYYILKDSIFSKTKHQQIMDLEEKYQSEKKNKKIELLNATTDSQIIEIKAKRQERDLWVGISILGFILTMVSIYFFINKKNLSEKLSAKNKIINKTLDEKDVLLREIHHRVKNNLQIISSLLNMQSRYLNDKKSKEAVNESKNRIKSMSLIHQKLYQEENLTGIETKAYFNELIESLMISYGINSEKVKTNITIENLLLDVDTAIPLGLILNEIISNTFKYGVNKDNGEFSFKFTQTTDNELFLYLKDNGNGIPKDFDISKSKSYGMKLIKSLSKKLKADLEFKNNNGLEITMKIHSFKASKTTKK